MTKYQQVTCKCHHMVKLQLLIHPFIITQKKQNPHISMVYLYIIITQNIARDDSQVVSVIVTILFHFTHTGPLEKTSGSDYPSLETTSIIMRTGRLSIRGCLPLTFTMIPGDHLNQVGEAPNCAFVSEVRVLECSDGRTQDAADHIHVFVRVCYQNYIMPLHLQLL